MPALPDGSDRDPITECHPVDDQERDPLNRSSPPFEGDGTGGMKQMMWRWQRHCRQPAVVARQPYRELGIDGVLELPVSRASILSEDDGLIIMDRLEGRPVLCDADPRWPGGRSEIAPQGFAECGGEHIEPFERIVSAV